MRDRFFPPALSLAIGLAAAACGARGSVLGTAGANSDSPTPRLTITPRPNNFPPSVTVTDVTVTNAVRVAGVKKLGLNVGGHDRWGAAKILKNILPNPGFEPGTMETVWLAESGSSSRFFTARYWNSTPGQPATLWDNASYEIVYGAAAGQTGNVFAFTRPGGVYRFELAGGPAVPLALQQNDVLMTRRSMPGARGMHDNVPAGFASPIPDTQNPFSGVQSLRMPSNSRFQYIMDTSWRDGDRSSHKLHVIEGPWRVRLKARSTASTESLRVSLHRDGGGPYAVNFLDRTFTPTSGWLQYEHTVTVPPGRDQTPHPWPDPTYRPALIFEVSAPNTNAGSVWIDEVELYRVDDSTNPTVFTDRFVDRLLQYQPGILRFWAEQLGESIDNQLQPWQTRGTCAFDPRSTIADHWNYGLHDFLQLCQHIGAEPWYVVPPTAGSQSLQNLMEYLGATAGPYATRRINMGQTAPWTQVFAKIHLEWGNEMWGSGDTNDPFGGASVSGGVRLGTIAGNRWAMLQGSPHHNSARINLVIGGQAGFAGRQQEIEANSSAHDSAALAPYFGELQGGWANDAQMFGPLFAYPFYNALHPNGRMRQSRDFLLAGGNGTALSIYEINFHTTSPITGLPAATRNEFVLGAAGAIALPLNMLVYLFELQARDQCAFASLGYAFRFDTSGGWPPQQHQFVGLWGMLRDLYHYNLARPTWLGCQLANRAMMGDGITTTHTGVIPRWTQSPMNGVGAATTVDYVQSFGFRMGNHYGVVLFNLDLVDAHGVRLHVPGSPRAQATLWTIDPFSLRGTNETSENVQIKRTDVTTFTNGYEIVLPRHSVHALTWHN